MICDMPGREEADNEVARCDRVRGRRGRGRRGRGRRGRGNPLDQDIGVTRLLSHTYEHQGVGKIEGLWVLIAQDEYGGSGRGWKAILYTSRSCQ